MGYARHIGRVGALAVTLGVGLAVASTPGIASAEPPSPSGDGATKTEVSSTDTPQSKPKTPSDRRTSLLRRVASAIGDVADASPSTQGSGPRFGAGAIKHRDAGSDTDGVNEAPPSSSDDDAPRAGIPPAQGEDETNDSVVGNAVERKSSRTRTTHTRNFGAESVDLASSVTEATQRVVNTLQKRRPSDRVDAPTTKVLAPTSTDELTTAATTFSAAIAPTAVAAVPARRTSVVSIVTDLLGSVLQPLISGGTGSGAPLQAPTLMAVLAAVRDEIERALLPRQVPPAPPQSSGQPPVYPDPPDDPTKQHVLVIAIDGTNLSRVMADDNNDKFFDLMDTSTNSAPSIVGHTTISNPSWTAILTGAWDNKTGVINNVYTPQTYDRWPTVFTQLETHDSDIWTKAIADWDVIAAIAASGSMGADDVEYIPQEPGDTNWSATDEAVTDATVETLKGTTGDFKGEAPNFLVSYLVQVDENGHMFGGDSPEYKAAIERTDENLGTILQAVADREEATGCGTGADTCEDWTVIVVTDHGHQPQPGFGHGFQSPDETDTFVIVDGPQFGNGVYNPEYQIVDVTPTVLSLFGAPECRDCDGVPLTSLRGSDSDPLSRDELQDLLEGQIAANDYPDIVTNVALSLRTIVAFVPYFVYGADLPAPLGDIAYVATNVPAQVVAFLTGVQGARLFPLLPPPPPITFIPEEATAFDVALLADCGDGSLAAATCIAS